MQFYSIAIVLLVGLTVYLLREKYLVSCHLVQLQADLSMWDRGNSKASGETLNGITPKRYQQKLIDRVRFEERLSGFAASVPGFFYSYRHGRDGSNSMPFASAGITALFGLQPEDVEFSIAPLTLRICRADMKLFVDEIARSAVDLTLLNTEFRIEHAEKGTLWIESRAMPRAHADGSIVWHGFMHDITERKRLEEQLARREQEFRTLAENSPDVLVRYDCQCRFVYVNPLFEKLYGVSLKDLLGKTPLQVPGLPDAEFFQQRVQEVVETGRADEFEHALPMPYGGMTDWRLVNIFPEFDADARVAYVQVLSRNVTSLKETEQQLEASRARLRQLLVHQGHRHECERKQLSWSMHEDLLQTLASMHMHASMLNTENMDARNKLRISNLILEVKKSIDSVREMVVFLRPAVLNMGIHLALEWMVSEFNYQHPELIFQLEYDAEVVQMDEKPSIVFFRIVQEVMAITERYRKSAKTSIALKRYDAGYCLILRDHSSACDVEISDGNCLGLFGLQELVMEMGGEMVIFSAAEHGLIIEASLPVLNR